VALFLAENTGHLVPVGVVSRIWAPLLLVIVFVVIMWVEAFAGLDSAG